MQYHFSGLKFSARIKGQDNIFANRTLPGNIGLVKLFEIKGNYFAPNDTLTCSGSNEITEGQSYCYNTRYNSSIIRNFVPSSVGWRHTSGQLKFDIDIPLSFEDEAGTPLDLQTIRDGLIIVGHGSTYDLRPSFPLNTIRNINVPAEDQGLALSYELLFRGVRSELLWDPTLSLLLFEPESSTTSPSSAGSTELASGINLAAAIAVPVVVVVVGVVLVAFFTIPAFKRAILPSSQASKQLRKRLAASTADGAAPETAPATTAERSKRWTTAVPRDTQ